MQKRIYLKAWLELKPYDKQTVTDGYYLKLCNTVKQAILTQNLSFVLQRFIDKVHIDYLACFLTSYFEDIISETNIWNTFVKIHQRFYKKPLPFYDTDEYYPGEINIQDVSFLIWYFLNIVQEEKLIAPTNTFIFDTAEKVMDTFDEAWDYAPENEYLKSFYQLNKNESDYYIARNLINTILFKTYLFHPDTFLKLNEQEVELIEDKENEENILTFLNDNRDVTLHNIHTCLLSLKGKEWASELLGNTHSLGSDFINLSQRISGFFFYKGQDETDLFIEHIASGKSFKLTKKSFDYYADLTEIDSILYMGIVKWKDEWWFSGVFFEQPFNADLILDEKNSIESRMVVNFLDHQKKETAAILKQQFNAFKDFNNGSQIAFMSSERIEDFSGSYIEYFNKSLNLSPKEKEEAIKRIRQDGFFGGEEDTGNLAEISDTALVFFNPKSGVEVAFGVNSAFPLDNNPFYEAEQSEDSIISLLVSEEMSTELVMYCLDNCKSKLPFFTKGAGKLYLKDMDFLLRFWKKDKYHTKPAITFAGKEM